MLNRCYIKLSLVNILEMVFVFIEILFKIVLFKGGVLIYAEHCICVCIDLYIIITIKRTKDLNYFSLCALDLFNTRVSQFELNY